MLQNMALGFSTALSPETLLYCALGVTLGTFIGVLPGIGALAAISMLLPITFHVPPTPAIIMLAGIYYGASYGGSTAAILINLPGHPAAAVSCLDGHPMAKQGRAGAALIITTIASFIGGTLTIFLVAGFAPPLAKVALSFGPAEYFSMMVLGLVAASTLAQGAPIKGLIMMVAGLVFGLVGVDVTSGERRYTFGLFELYDGLSLVAVAMGLFGVSEIIANAGSLTARRVNPRDITWRSLMPTRDDLYRCRAAFLRGTGIGSFFGILPGTGISIASFVAYAVEKRVSRHPESFGTGAVEGLAAPEAANNAAAQSAFIPTLTLGIPGDAIMALILGALIINGITPGPTLIADEPELFWGLIASFWIGNVLLLILNAPLVGIWVRMLTIPYSVLYPAILVFICIGVYSVNSLVFDVVVTLIFGAVGYGMMLLKFSPAPLLLGFILGPMIEENFRRALLMARGDLSVFVTQPISAALLAVSAALLFYMVWSSAAGRPGAARGASRIPVSAAGTEKE